MLKLTPHDDRQEEPESLLFPADAVRLLQPNLPVRHTRGFDFDPIRHVEDALQRVDADFARLRAQFNGDDHPRAA